MHAAYNELRSVNVFPLTTCFVGTNGKVFESFLVVVGRHQIVEYYAITDFSGEFHHLHASSAKIDGNILWSAVLIHIIKFDTIKMHKLTVHSDCLVGQQCTNSSHNFSHCTKWLVTSDANFGSKWIPPCTNSKNHSARSKVVECRECCGKACRVACPAINNA